MSEAKHTHAPMTMHHDHGWLVVSDASDDVCIKIAKGFGTGKEQSLARLIAAAPDLLADLQEACDRIEDLVSRLGGTDPEKATESYRATIAKATGGAA